MARVSRSSKKQPAFDPSELQDLIFSPAVGSGVGSHLLGATENLPAPAETQEDKALHHASTVDMSISDTVADIGLSTVDISIGQKQRQLPSAASIIQRLPLVTKLFPESKSHLTTVAISEVSTVGVPDTSIVDNSTSLVTTEEPQSLNKGTEDTIYQTTVDAKQAPTVVDSDLSIVTGAQLSGESAIHEQTSPELVFADELSNLNQGREEVPSEIRSDEVPTDLGTVATSNLSTVDATIKTDRTPKDVVLWISEQGDLVPQGRVKRIRLAQDVINSAEESVYDTLWTAKNQTDEREVSRVVQAGYDYLVKRTRLSKKTIQRIVAKLIDKDFIAIERPADIYQRTSTVYRVFSYKAVLDRHVQRGRSHVAKMGPGFSYVHPMEDPRRSAVNAARQGNLSTVDKQNAPTVVKKAPSTPANPTTEIVAGSDGSTVVRPTTTFIGRVVLDNNSSSSSAIHQVLSKYGVVDDDVVDRLIRNCKHQAPDCTIEEIIHFIEEKGSLVRVKDSRIYSPIGFLLTAVPKCLSGDAFRFYREEQMKRREAEAAYEARRQAELDEWRREQEAQLTDSSVSEEDKQLIREWLRIR
jgi:predicted transcriptional regulator